MWTTGLLWMGTGQRKNRRVGLKWRNLCLWRKAFLFLVWLYRIPSSLACELGSCLSSNVHWNRGFIYSLALFPFWKAMWGTFSNITHLVTCDSTEIVTWSWWEKEWLTGRHLSTFLFLSIMCPSSYITLLICDIITLGIWILAAENTGTLS